MKILLHVCCAPCLIYPLEKLKEQGHEVEGIFYNPNIHPSFEYKKRKQAVSDFAAVRRVSIIYPQYLPQDFFRAVNLNEEKPGRCAICWQLRLEKTAQYAKANNFDAFTTTLLVSPYQDQEVMKKIGNSIAESQGLIFHYEDFRPGFRKAHEQARKQGVYCQKYCGCLYGELEQCKQSAKC